MRVSLGLATTALLLLSGACTHASSQARPTTDSSPITVAQGHLGGVLMISPPMSPSFATRGTIVLSGVVTRRIAVGADGRFDVDVPAGDYSVTGHSPLYGGGSYTCGTSTIKNVTVPAGGSATTTVSCLEK